MFKKMFNRDYPVSKSKVAFYQKNGYVQFDNVLNNAEVEALRNALNKAGKAKKGYARDLAAEEDDSSEDKNEKILQMLNLWENFPAVKAYLESGITAKIAQKLTSSEEIHLYHDQALIKEPGPSAPSPWHQDQPYWPSKQPGMLSCWMALDDVTIERGCMQFIPNSHNWGEFDPVSFTGDPDSLKKMVPEKRLSQWDPQPVEMKAGSCTFHHGLTFHYANANTTDSVRRALVAIFIPNGITYAGDEKMENPFTDTITSKKGEPLRGSKFLKLV